MKKLSRTTALMLVAATLLSGCSMLTAQGRRERAYQRYVHKSSLGRVKQQKLFAGRESMMPVSHAPEVMEATEASGPESVSDRSGQ